MASQQFNMTAVSSGTTNGYTGYSTTYVQVGPGYDSADYKARLKYDVSSFDATNKTITGVYLEMRHTSASTSSSTAVGTQMLDIILSTTSAYEGSLTEALNYSNTKVYARGITSTLRPGSSIWYRWDITKFFDLLITHPTHYLKLWGRDQTSSGLSHQYYGSSTNIPHIIIEYEEGSGTEPDTPPAGDSSKSYCSEASSGIDSYTGYTSFINIGYGHDTSSYKGRLKLNLPSGLKASQISSIKLYMAHTSTGGAEFKNSVQGLAIAADNNGTYNSSFDATMAGALGYVSGVVSTKSANSNYWYSWDITGLKNILVANPTCYLKLWDMGDLAGAQELPCQYYSTNSSSYKPYLQIVYSGDDGTQYTIHYGVDGTWKVMEVYYPINGVWRLCELHSAYNNQWVKNN